MPDPVKVTSKLFQAGLDARGHGKPATACPYPDGSSEREQWLEGWHRPEDDEPEELGFA